MDSDKYVVPFFTFNDDLFIRTDNSSVTTHTVHHGEHVSEPSNHGATHAFNEIMNMNTNKLDQIKIQAVLDTHKKLSHMDIRKCAFCLGIRLKDMQCHTCYAMPIMCYR